MPKGNLRTPAVKVRELQEKLHRSAKARRQRRGQGYTEYPTDKLYKTFALYKLPTHLRHAAPNACG